MVKCLKLDRRGRLKVYEIRGLRRCGSNQCKSTSFKNRDENAARNILSIFRGGNYNSNDQHQNGSLHGTCQDNKRQLRRPVGREVKEALGTGGVPDAHERGRGCGGHEWVVKISNRVTSDGGTLLS